MKHTTLIYISVGLAALLLLFLQFGVRSTPSLKVKKNMPGLADATADFENILTATKAALPEADHAKIDALEAKTDDKQAPEVRVAALKQLAMAWNELNKFAIGGKYSTDIAALAPSDSAWSIAGTTFMLALKQQDNENLRIFAAANAQKAFENAISLNPTDITHKINLALIFVESGDNPMKGIGMLTQIAKDNPKNPIIFLTLGKLAMRTAQYDKAIGRFETVLSLEPRNQAANCLLADAYENSGQHEKALPFAKLCK